jgi:hypothetical protein
MQSTAGVAYDLPHRNPEGWCDHAAQQMREESRASTRHHCIEREQGAYERLKDEWPLATDGQQREAASRYVGSADSYESLEIVLGAIMARDNNLRRLKEQQKLNHFKFD